MNEEGPRGTGGREKKGRVGGRYIFIFREIAREATGERKMGVEAGERESERGRARERERESERAREGERESERDR
eukprot:168266-Amorphochlora_amoeboformis.AAC.1